MILAPNVAESLLDFKIAIKRPKHLFRRSYGVFAGVHVSIGQCRWVGVCGCRCECVRFKGNNAFGCYWSVATKFVLTFINQSVFSIK